MARTSITIVLEVDGSLDRPCGIARLRDGTRRSFEGWLGLADAIDSLAAIEAHDDAGPARPSDRRKLDRHEGNER
jgi:hypothetical protein